MDGLINKKIFLLDMDGTIYLENTLFEGVVEFLQFLKANNLKYLFLTNNSSKSVVAYIEKLNKMGIKATKDDFMTSSMATAAYLKNFHLKDNIYLVGTKSLKEELESVGLSIYDELNDEINCLVVGYDTELNYRKIEEATKLLIKGVPYIATNPDLVCPMSYGYLPDCGSFCQMFKNATGRTPKVIGKPETYMIDAALEKYGYKKEQALLVGDRIYTDIASGNKANISTAIVLTGESTREDVLNSDLRFDYVLNHIMELYEALKKIYK